MIRYLLAYFLICVSTVTLAQPVPGVNDPAKAYNDYCDKIYQTDPATTLVYARKGLVKAQAEHNTIQTARAYEMIGVAYDYLGKFDTALVYFDQAAVTLSTENNDYYKGRIMKSKANSLFSLSRLDEALKYYVEAHELAVKRNDENEAANLLMGIGNVYSEMRLHNKALKNYFTSLEIKTRLNDSALISYLYTNISETYDQLNNKGEQYRYLKKSLAIKEKLRDDYGLVFSYANLCHIMADYQEKDSSVYYGRKAVATAKKINNIDFLMSVYNNFGEAFLKLNETDSARHYLQLSVKMAAGTNNILREHEALKVLATVYEKKGLYRDAYTHLQRFLVLNDTIFNQDMRKSLNEMHAKYETEKVEKENSLLTERDKKRQVVIYAVAGGLVLLSLLSLLLLNRYRLKQKTTVALQKQNTEIERQKKTIEEKQKEIIDSMNYAQRIQKAQLASSQLLKRNLKDTFILYKPKDIVSGDFYWAYESRNGFYLCVADSTGHGVPGAFMSLLNISYLNEAIVEKQITEPHKILQYVSQRLTQSMYHEDTGESGKDGMDGVLFRIEKDRSKISFAAANNGVWIYEKAKNILTEIKADKQPVGKGEKEITDFTLHEKNFETGDIFYAQTDGYADQFGGPQGKKFKYRNLMQLVESNANIPFNDQFHVLDQTLVQWKGDLEQVDDILVVGFSII